MWTFSSHSFLAMNGHTVEVKQQRFEVWWNLKCNAHLSRYKHVDSAGNFSYITNVNKAIMKRLKYFCVSDFTFYLHTLLVVVFKCTSITFKHFSHHLGVFNELDLSNKPQPNFLWHIDTHGHLITSLNIKLGLAFLLFLIRSLFTRNS